MKFYQQTLLSKKSWNQGGWLRGITSATQSLNIKKSTPKKITKISSYIRGNFEKSGFCYIQKLPLFFQHKKKSFSQKKKFLLQKFA